jgi:hypothetical protein
LGFYQGLSFPAESDERRHQRHDVDFAGRVRELGSTAAKGQVRDVSIGGCRLAQTDIPKNAEIWVNLGVSRPMRARVVWVGPGEAGCQFYAPLTRAELRDVMLQRIG